MNIEIERLLPSYLKPSDVEESEVYLCNRFTLEHGQRYLVHGPSGSGKSSFLKCLYGMLPFSGSIRYEEGNPGSERDWVNMRRQKLAYIFQGLQLFPTMTVTENIRLKADLTGHKRPNEIAQMLTELGLEEKQYKLARELSFGQRQRVAIIRALCQPFRFLICDEPFSHLDYQTALTVCELIDRELRSQGAGLLLSSLSPESPMSIETILKV